MRPDNKYFNTLISIAKTEAYIEAMAECIKPASRDESFGGRTCFEVREAINELLVAERARLDELYKNGDDHPEHLTATA